MYPPFAHSCDSEDIFKLLSEPVPAVDALFMNREKYEFTINSAELHKSKSGEPMVAVYEGVRGGSITASHATERVSLFTYG